jgi:glycosyltransferase involved in cell wall biosynthesis
VYEALTRASGYDAVVLAASARGDQAAAAALARLKPRQPVVLQDSTWKRGTSRLDRFASRAGVRLLDGPSSHFCVLSAAEQRKFPASWGVDPARVHLTPWDFGLSEEELESPVSREGYVFAGGDSMRDYRPLIAAAGSLSAPVRIAARAEPPVGRASMPRNVEYGPMPEDEYFRAMCGADVVVVALAADTERSAGQNNYLNPMALGKLVIVTDGTGVGEYVESGRTALIVPPGDEPELAAAITWALDPANAEEAEAIARRGRDHVRERFSPDAYVDRLLEVVAAASDATTAG